MGKCWFHASSFIFDWIIIKVVGKQDRHKSLDEFDFGPLVSMAHLYVFWNEIWRRHIGLRWAIVALWATCLANLSLKTHVWAYIIGRLNRQSHWLHSSNNLASETAGPVKDNFHMELQWDGGMKVCSNVLGHVTKMATMPICCICRSSNTLVAMATVSIDCCELMYLVLSRLVLRAGYGIWLSVPDHCLSSYFRMGKVKIEIYCYLIADIFTKSFYRNVCWVVLHQAYHSYPNVSIWLVPWQLKG